jgi:peptide/nickel transport system substrate-binding protein
MVDNRISDLVSMLWSGEISRRDFMRRAAIAGFSASTITAALSQAASAAPGSAKRGLTGLRQTDQGTLVIADSLSGSQWLTLDPSQYYEINPSAAMNMLYEALYTIPDGAQPNNITPMLATELPQFSEDGLTATIPLRQGVKFHTSGNEMKAADVVFSFNRLKFGAAQGSFLGADYWTAVEAVDDYTVKLTLASPNAALAAVLTSIPLSITDSARVKEMGGTDAEPAQVGEGEVAPEVEANQAARDQINGDSVGTGPFMVSQWDINSDVIIVKNPDYWGEASALDQIIWRNTLEANAQVQSLQTGEVDISYSLPVDQIEAVRGDSNLQVLEGPTLAICYIGLNTAEAKGGILAKKEARQAIGYAIDYDGFVNDLMSGAAQRPATIVPLPLLGSEDVLPKAYTLDLAKAQQLWDSISAGEQEIEFIYDSDTPAPGGASYETLAQKLQSDLQQINGLTVKLTPMPGADRLTKYRAGDFQATISPWTPDFPDVDSYVGPFARSGTAAAKRVGFSDPAVDALLDQGLTEFDVAARTQIYVQIQEALLDAAPYHVLYQPTGLLPTKKIVQGAAVHSVYIYQLRGASKTA